MDSPANQIDALARIASDPRMTDCEAAELLSPRPVFPRQDRLPMWHELDVYELAEFVGVGRFDHEGRRESDRHD